MLKRCESLFSNGKQFNLMGTHHSDAHLSFAALGAVRVGTALKVTAATQGQKERLILQLSPSKGADCSWPAERMLLIMGLWLKRVSNSVRIPMKGSAAGYSVM